MPDFFEKEGLNINHQHKTWTPDDQIKYEKEMIKYRLKISAIMVGGSILLIFLSVFMFKLF